MCVLTFDRPGSAANILDTRTLTDLGEELDFIAGSPQLKGVVLTSAKTSVFVAGADLHELSEGVPPEDVRRLIELGQTVMNRLAALRIPTVAAIHGAALGGGCEICLACDSRIASADRVTKIGLPETQLGLLPAWGGASRLPRLIGLVPALDLILRGTALTADQARECGLLDELVPADDLIEAAVRMVKRGKTKSRTLKGRLPDNRLSAAVIAARLRPRWLKKTRGNLPAVLKALQVVTRGISKPLAESLALERDAILELVQTEASHNLIRLFFLQDRARKQTVPGLNATPSPAPVKRAAVIGAGVMGAGIAQWLSARRLPVILSDIGADQVARGVAAITKVYEDGVRRHLFTPEEARDGLGRVRAASDDASLREADLLIEAAVENLAVKKDIFRRRDGLAGENALLATNTSALPVSELAAVTRRPDRVLGLHFFNPVHRMQLVEVVVARQTSPAALQRALRFVQQIGKLPVVVKDSPGFISNRLLMPYLIESVRLFETGADVTDLDEAMLEFGMPMGPMRLLDEIGIDVAHDIAQTLAASFPDRLAVPAAYAAMIRAGLLGRKTGRGFYLHNQGKAPRPNPEVTRIRTSLPTKTISPAASPGGTETGGHSAAVFSRQDLQERMIFLMINEAARCLEEQIVADAADIDLAMVLGIGFAPFRGGPLRYADAVGAATLKGAMECLVDRGATRFAPCALLRRLAATGKKFYSSPGSGAQPLPVAA